MSTLASWQAESTEAWLSLTQGQRDECVIAVCRTSDNAKRWELAGKAMRDGGIKAGDVKPGHRQALLAWITGGAR